jgi:ferredoxin-type protein NapF
VASRRDLFNSFTKPLRSNQEEDTPLLIRPPYGKDESIFQSECPSCEDKACVASCDEEIIFIAKDGTPTLNFEKNGCTFCDDCAKACSKDVLSLENTNTAESLSAIFRISLDGCVAHHGVICYSCKEPCIDDAILFNGMFNPIIDENRCTGCGFCVARCPVEAIEYRVIELKEQKDESTK